MVAICMMMKAEPRYLRRTSNDLGRPVANAQSDWSVSSDRKADLQSDVSDSSTSTTTTTSSDMTAEYTMDDDTIARHKYDIIKEATTTEVVNGRPRSAAILAVNSHSPIQARRGIDAGESRHSQSSSKSPPMRRQLAAKKSLGETSNIDTGISPHSSPESKLSVLARRPLPEIPCRSRSPRLLKPAKPARHSTGTSPMLNVQKRAETDQNRLSPTPSNGVTTSTPPSPGPNRSQSQSPSAHSPDGLQGHAPLHRTKAMAACQAQSALSSLADSGENRASSPSRQKRPVQGRSESVPQSVQMSASRHTNLDSQHKRLERDGYTPSQTRSDNHEYCKQFPASLSRSQSQPLVKITYNAPPDVVEVKRRCESDISAIKVAKLYDNVTAPLDIEFLDEEDEEWSMRVRPAFHDDNGMTFWKERCHTLQEELTVCRALLEVKTGACQQLQEQLAMIRKNMNRLSVTCNAHNEDESSLSSTAIDVRDLSQQQVSKLLSAYALEQYQQAFRLHDIDGLAFASLSHSNLEELGVKSRQHRNKILRLARGNSTDGN